MFFGHQSVGSDILEGIKDDFPDLPIIDIEGNPRGEPSTGLFHARIGKNGDALSKLDSFCEYVLSPRHGYDLAVMKLCYADINRNSDINETLSQYMSMTKRLQIEIPMTKLIHTTVPLRVIRLGARSFLRKWTGRRVNAIDDNSARHLFNQSLRQHFVPPHRIFDLARIESTTPTGNPCNIKYFGGSVPSLFPAYSTDGGHLNALGKSIFAREFVSMLQSA